jgi:1-acyl-sn-glycerol-3-phosphate acyltransferase
VPAAERWPDLGYGPRRLPGARLRITRWVARLLVLPLFRLRVEGRTRLPAAPSVVVFNHLDWIDPFVLVAAMPAAPRLVFFGPREDDMTTGGRNRLMRWAGNCVPYRPGNRDMVHAIRRVEELLATDAVLAIAGEGRIHVGESSIGPLTHGAAYLAIRGGVPIVPVAINGTSWLAFGRTIRVRIGTPIPTTGLDHRRDAARLTEAVFAALAAMVADYPDPSPPGPAWRWLTEVFNDWPEGERPPIRPPD